jgi:hypothetical protein
MRNKQMVYNFKHTRFKNKFRKECSYENYTVLPSENERQNTERNKQGK